MNYLKDFETAQAIPDIFETVKEIVRKKLGKSRAGLELGLKELGNEKNGFLGAFYVAGSNMIVMNETPLRRIQETNPKLLKSYIFSILLHEYLHSLGYLKEEDVRRMTHEICFKTFGDCLITEFARDLSQFMPYLIYPEGSPRTDSRTRKVKNFDKSSIRYIG